MTSHPQPKSITFTFLLDGKSVCGQEQRPDRCEDCSEMPNCILDCFYDALSKGEGCVNHSNATERDKVLAKIQKITSMWNNGSPDDDEVLQELGLLEDELRTTPEAHR